MSGDHKILVRRYDPRRHARIAHRDARSAGCVGASIKRNAKPLSVIAHTSPNFCSIFADPTGEYDSVETTKCRRERTEFASNSIDEEINSLFRGRKLARQQCAHIAGQTRHAEKT